VAVVSATDVPIVIGLTLLFAAFCEATAGESGGPSRGCLPAFFSILFFALAIYVWAAAHVAVVIR
jgi:hypothetical protein